MELLRCYVRALRRPGVQASVLLFYGAVAALGALYGPGLLSATKLSVEPPAGSYSATAHRVLVDRFPGLSNASTALVLIDRIEKIEKIENIDQVERRRAADVGAVLRRLPSTPPHSRDESIFLSLGADKHWSRVRGKRAAPANSIANSTAARRFEADLLSRFRRNGTRVSPCLEAFDSYFHRAGLGQTAEASRFTTKAGDAMIEMFTLTIGCGQAELSAFATRIMDATRDASARHLAPAGLQARVTGIDAFLVDVLHGVEHDIALVDAVAFPIALAILASVLQSCRLLLLPVVCMLLSILGSFSIMRPVAEHMDVITFAPSVQMSLSIALSIDYSLFLLGRYREELLMLRAQPRAATAAAVGKDGNKATKAEATAAAAAAAAATVEAMLRHAGHVVVVSNTTLTVCFLGNLFFSSVLLQTIGIAAATTCACALVVNVTLVPTLLLLFPNFFARSVEPGSCYCCSSSGGSSSGGSRCSVDRAAADQLSVNSSSKYSFLDDHSGFGSGFGSDFGSDYVAMHDREEVEPTTSTATCWEPCARSVVRFHKTIVLCTLLLAVPFGWRIAQGFRHSTSMLQLVPRGANSTKAYKDLAEYFGDGISNPYRVVIVAPPGQPILGGPRSYYTLDKSFCNVTRHVLKHYVAGSRSVADTAAALPSASTTMPAVNISAQVASLAYVSSLSSSGGDGGDDINLCASVPGIGGGHKDVAEVCGALAWSKDIALHGASCADLRYLYDRYNVTSAAGEARKATFADVAIDVDPNTPSAGLWYQAVLKGLDRAQREHAGYDFYIVSLATVQYEMSRHSFSIFPVAVVVTAGVVFVLIGLAFRSAVVPLRAVLSIGLTLVLVYGAAIFVYEDGALAWLHFAGLAPLEEDASLSWIPPILSFSIVVGLGLDYDVFLLSRIVEAREEEQEEEGGGGGGGGGRRSDRDAIVVGLTKSGATITAAGCIMAVAFSGLLFSAEPVLNQISFFLVFAVLIDTFLIRALFVPALMCVLEGYNFWPRRMPEVGGGRAAAAAAVM
jgi:uncharacterized membrane protein YdfJ with MMPL/SSD domain